MSAIDRMRDIVATHSNAEAILWIRSEFVAVLQEIDELSEIGLTLSKRAVDAEKALALARGERDYWMAYRTEGPPSSDGYSVATLESPGSVLVTLEELGKLIGVAVREAGKP